MKNKDTVSQYFADVSPEKILAAASDINSQRSWFQTIRLWRIRRSLDLLIKGRISQLLRFRPMENQQKDPSDFWQVQDYDPFRYLILQSLMKLPGKATLEFTIGKQTLLLSLSFLPQGVAGKYYWKLSHPFHPYILTQTLKHVLREAQRKEQEDPQDR